MQWKPTQVVFFALFVALAGCQTAQPQPEATVEPRGAEPVEEGEAPQAEDLEQRGESHSEAWRVELVEPPRVEGSGVLSAEAIAGVFEREEERTVGCFKSLEGDLAEPSRQVILNLRLSLDGVVLEVQSSAQDEVGRCLAAEVASWEFPKPRGGAIESSVKLRYKPEGEGDGEEAGEEGAEPR